MSLKIKHLNADSSFLLTFSATPETVDGTLNTENNHAGSFSILLDPWLLGPCKTFSSKFALTRRIVPPCVNSLAELPPPDLVLVSQDKADHCNEETLRTLPSSTGARILGTPGAVRRIKSWKHFDPDRIQALKKFDAQRPETVHRIEVPATSNSGIPGEVTIALLAAKVDLTGLHNAIAITYRPPSYGDNEVVFPPSPPATPPIDLSRSIEAGAGETHCKEAKTLSVIYSPHGVSYDSIVKPYANSHLAQAKALPVDLLLHCIDRATNPWYFGGNVASGSLCGIQIAHALKARVWIRTHDEDKENSGLSVRRLTIEKHGLECVRKELKKLRVSEDERDGQVTEMLDLSVGEEYTI